MRRILLLIAFLAPLAGAAAAREAGWDLLRQGGAVALVRHALAPGVGDPPGFLLDDCRTQRLLSAAGRAQAEALGRMFRQQGVRVAAVLSSRWCRCLETAHLAFGRVEPFPALDSLFGEAATAEARTAEVRERLRRWDGLGTLVLVTHQVNITALTGIYPASGEIIVLARQPDGGFAPAGRIAAPEPD